MQVRRLLLASVNAGNHNNLLNSNYKVVPGQAQAHSSTQLLEKVCHEAVNE
jgi:hypothetical protein